MTAMTTTLDWWRRTKADPERLLAWLLDQYRGEATAAERIRGLRDRFGGVDARAFRVLTLIAAQEEKHARWVGGLVAARRVIPRVDDVRARYWQEPLRAIADFATGCAVGAHAEKMRLERIEVIAGDCDAPADVRAVFARILPEERFHERAFRMLAGAEALARTKDAHDAGRAALGLAP